MGGGNNSNNGRAGGIGMVGGMTNHNSGTGLSQPQQPAMRSSSMPVPNQAMGGRFPGQGQGQGQGPGGGMMGGGVQQGMNMNINGMGLPFNGIQHPMGGGGGAMGGAMGGMQQQQQQQKQQGQGQQPGGLGQGLGQGGQMQFDAFSGMRPTGMQQQQQPPSNPNNPQQQNPRRF